MVIRHKDILRFYVAVNHLVRVGSLQRFRDFDRDPQAQGLGQRSVLSTIALRERPMSSSMTR